MRTDLVEGLDSLQVSLDAEGKNQGDLRAECAW
jgi:hypothetical protein